MLNFGRSVRAVVVAGLVVAGGALVSQAQASVIAIQSVVASSSYGGYEAGYAIDDPTANTDWATGGQQTGATLRIDLGLAQALGIVNVTDRVTSGAAQGVFGGQTVDYTTSYTLQAYTDATFSTAIGPAVTKTSTAPAQPTSLASFQSTADLTGVTAEFVQYTINAAQGADPGLENITFNTPNAGAAPVPEPSSIAMLLLAVGLVWTSRRNSNTV